MIDNRRYGGINMNKNNKMKSIRKYWKVATAFTLMTSIGASYHLGNAEASSHENAIQVAHASNAPGVTKAYAKKKEDDKENPDNYGIIVDFNDGKGKKEPAKPIKEEDNKYVKKVKGLFTSSKYKIKNAPDGFDVSYKDKTEHVYRTSDGYNEYKINGSHSKRTFDVSAKAIKALGCALTDKEIKTGLDKAKSKWNYRKSGVIFSYSPSKDYMEVGWSTKAVKQVDNKYVKKVRGVYNSSRYELISTPEGFFVLDDGEPNHSFGTYKGDSFYMINNFLSKRSLDKAAKAIRVLGCKLTEKQIRTGLDKALDTDIYTKKGVDFYIDSNTLIVDWYH